jgi:hypothetical protein
MKALYSTTFSKKGLSIKPDGTVIKNNDIYCDGLESCMLVENYMFGGGFINAKPIISMNNFYNPQNKSITYNSDSFTQSNIDLRNNYWGGMTSTELDDVFFDANDTPDKAHIFLFEPMSNSVNDTTGISNSADSTDSTNSTNSTDSGYSSNPENIITCSSLDGAYVYSREEPPVYLGFFGNQFALDSILNKFGTYGSSYNLTSVRNTYGTYGSPYSIYSVASPPNCLHRQIASFSGGFFVSNRISLD